MRIDKTCAKLSVHKKLIELCSTQWGCDKPMYRVYGESRTFGAMVLLFSNLNLSSMSLQGREGAYATLGVKVMGYLLLLGVSRSTGRSFHQIQLEMSGQREMLFTIIAHFHEREFQYTVHGFSSLKTSNAGHILQTSAINLSARA